MSFLQDPDWGECCKPILLSPTHPNAELIKISGYTLVYCSGACPKIYRVYKGESMLGLVFQHLTHWSSGVDQIRYAKPLNAVVALDDFLLAASMTKTTDENIAA
ncbi:hypothetical protein H6G80_30185 [Nostoc sp. FACHB-87]|uniref:hypothetical protein n=1 Tax=Nostocaceae TaxID=1162 RepID=UPI001682965B|nr:MULTISPECIES: hypothetical protein [Nostocaceae]MBD2458324.1 hypothetical protein [Nostoc sp. FACHB-87]MBD2479365.1 hypothetical protein [Anabaena sp. FACHB-83]